MGSPAETWRSRSLAEIHSSVGTSHASPWRRLLAFAGPAYLVSVGYMDPGNWATDLEGGARFGYRLLWVLVMSNAMAVLLQTLSARLGVVSGRDLAQACREAYPRAVSRALWALCEVAIVACDLAEVLGAAIALNLLFQIPLLAGVLVTAADTLLLLWLQQYRIRALELIVVRLIVIVGFCLGMEILLAKPAALEVVTGLVPRLDRGSLFAAMAMLGATVMPHNLYLHSALVQTRRFGTSQEAKRKACRYNFVDTMLALNAAMLVNIALLVLAGAVFFKRGIEVTEVQQATRLLEPLLGTKTAAIIFSIALLCAGQASTLTGTMAGQIVMEGFLNIRIRAWLRRLMTRLIAIVPAALTIYFTADKGAYQLLLVSQVVLALQLPFAMVPLIHLTADRRRMGQFASKPWLQGLAWIVAGINLVLIFQLAVPKLAEWLAPGGLQITVLRVLGVPLMAGLVLLLLYLVLEPLLHRPQPGAAAQAPAEPVESPIFMDHVSADEAQPLIERFGAFMNYLHGIAFIKDPAGRYVYINNASALFGLDPEEVLSKTDGGLLSPEFAAGIGKNDEAVLRDQKTFAGVEVIPHHGVPHSWLMYKFPICERDTQSVFLGAVGLDITDRRQAEEQLRGLAARLQIVREQERTLTSREIHDIGQLLVALDVQLSMLSDQLSEGLHAGALTECLKAASGLLASTIESTARISGELRPSVVDNLGLTAALEWHAREFESRTGIPVVSELEEARLDPEVRIAVFRLFQNILANIEQHARATEVRVSLRKDVEALVFQIRDNGRGITPQELADPRSLGLIEMREMVRMFGGKIHICGAPGEGTTVCLDIPVDARMAGPDSDGHGTG